MSQKSTTKIMTAHRKKSGGGVDRESTPAKHLQNVGIKPLSHYRNTVIAVDTVKVSSVSRHPYSNTSSQGTWPEGSKLNKNSRTGTNMS